MLLQRMGNVMFDGGNFSDRGINQSLHTTLEWTIVTSLRQMLLSVSRILVCWTPI